MDCEVREELISQLITAKANKEDLEKLDEIFDKFLDFSKKVVLKGEGEVVLKLKKLENKIKLILSYPELHKKSIVAVGGGFSAGKSEFISSFIDGIKLPVGIEPTTAIATYVLNGDNKLIACNYKGGSVNLRDIDSDFHKKFSHKFLKSFKFNLKEILSYLVLATNFEYENLCFIDTPGYNPANKDNFKDDVNISKEFLNKSDAFIWLIGLDVTGTIPSSDLEFIESLDLENKKLFIVLNKADLKSEDDLEEILDEVEEVLEDYDIEFEGISAYSSIRKKEFLFRKKSLYDYLKENNKTILKIDEIVNELIRIYLKYKIALLVEKKEKNEIYKVLHSLSLDLLQEDIESENPIIRLENLKSYFKFNKDYLIKELDELFSKLEELLSAIFNVEIDFNLDRFSYLSENDVDLLKSIDENVEAVLDSRDDEIEFDF